MPDSIFTTNNCQDWIKTKNSDRIVDEYLNDRLHVLFEIECRRRKYLQTDKILIKPKLPVKIWATLLILIAGLIFWI